MPGCHPEDVYFGDTSIQTHMSSCKTLHPIFYWAAGACLNTTPKEMYKNNLVMSSWNILGKKKRIQA